MTSYAARACGNLSALGATILVSASVVVPGLSTNHSLRLAQRKEYLRVDNPQLTKEQRSQLFGPLFERVKTELHTLSGGDARLMWALRRKLAKELVYIERSTPAARSKLKALM